LIIEGPWSTRYS